MVGVLKTLSLLSILLGTFISTLGHAQTNLSISVDQNKLYQSELLNMTVVADSEIELSLGGLFNIAGSQIDPPEFENLEQYWEVIDRQQSYNMRSVNGKSNSQITWRYTLSPKQSGNLFIPKASFKDTESAAVAIEVLPGSPPRDATAPPFVFLEASIDKNESYVQEQAVYTLTIFTRGQLANGDMSSPSHPDLIIESLGDTEKGYRMMYSQRYETHERKYLLFPQKSGKLTIDPQSFTGTVVDNRTRRTLRTREISNAIELDVKPPPSGYSGTTWLPAKALFLSETWDPKSTEIAVGDSLTRSVELSSLGLLASALPPIEQALVDNFKVYPDQAQLESAPHIEGVQSVRIETAAFVAITPGEVTLPAISIPWWDTVNNVERLAELPTRTIMIKASPQTTAQATPGSSSSLNQAYQAPSDKEPVSEPSSSAKHNTDPSTDTNATPTQTDVALSAKQWPWIVALLVALAAWGFHVYWLTSRSKNVTSEQAVDEGGKLKASDAALKNALSTKSPDLSRYACEWISLQTGQAIRTLDQLSDFDGDLGRLLRNFDKLTYTQDTSTQENAVQLDQICKDIKLHLKNYHTAKAGKQGSEKHLPPLYPKS